MELSKFEEKLNPDLVKYKTEQLIKMYSENSPALKVIAEIPCGLVILTIDKDCIYSNNEWEKITGIGITQSKQMGWLSAFNALDLIYLFEGWHDQIKDGKKIEFESSLTKKSSLNNKVKMRFTKIINDDGEIIGSMGFASDSSEFNQVKEKLELNSIRLNQYFNLSTEIAVIGDAGGNLSKVNRSFLNTLGYTEQEVIGKNIISFVSPETIEQTIRIMKRVEIGEVTLNFENTMLCKNGIVKNVVWNVSIDKETQSVFATGRDITNILDAEVIYEAAQRLGNVGSWWIDLSTKEIIWSKQMYLIFKRDYQFGPPSNLEEMSMHIHPEDRADWLNSFEINFQRKEGFKLQFRIIKNDIISWIDAKREVTKNHSGEVIRLHAVCHDITEMKQAEELILQEQKKSLENKKMATIGKMASGVAHEINNPLMIISNHIKRIKKNITNKEKIEESSVSIQNACDKISNIVSSLGKCSSEKVLEKNWFNIASILKDSISLVTLNLLENKILIYQEFADVGELYCNRNELQQVVLNLLKNSIDAVKNQNEKWIKLTLIERNDQLVITVIDSGKNMNLEQINQFFYPFYTTKNIGEGVGLGLSVSKGIIESHNGSISAKLVDGHTCFEICIKRNEAIKLIKSA
jgi:PAS domain S-box-containing protein